MPLLPEDIEEYNLDSHSVRFVNGVTVTLSRDGAVGVGESRISERDAFEKALADLEDTPSDETEDADADQEDTPGDADAEVGPESVGTEIEVNPEDEPEPFDFGSLGADEV
jgi:hypothetical protein